MHNNLMEQLQLCAATSSLQNLFARPATLFKLFCPTLAAKNPRSDNNNETSKRPFPSSNVNDPNKKRCMGTIVNTTGQRIIFPRGLEKRYCSDFLDTSRYCAHGENCTFVHALYPSGFTDADKEIVTKFVNETEGLSFQKNVSGKKEE